MALKHKLIRIIVLGSLICGVCFNFWVLGSCEFLVGSGDLQVGVFRYSLDLEGDEFDTNGKCENYDSGAEDGWIRTAQVCSGLAPAFGLLLILMVFVNQYLFTIPCSARFVGVCYTGAQISTSLIWLIYKTDLCSSSCDWSDAATANIIAQIMYFVAAVFHKCMQDPKEAREERKADTDRKKAEQEAALKQQEETEAQTELEEQKKVVEAKGAADEQKATET